MLKKLLKDKRFLTVFLSICILVGVFSVSNFLYTLNKGFQNKYYTFKDVFFEKKASKEIIIIEIDEKTLQNLGRFPFSRDIYPQVFKNLNSKGVAVIGMDIIFADTSEELSDLALEQGLKEAKNIVVGNAILDNGQIEDILPRFDSVVLSRGFFPPLIDRKNNTVYSILPYIETTKEKIDHFSISLYKAYYSYIFRQELTGLSSGYSQDFFSIADAVHIPLSGVGKKEILINFIDSKKFQKVSFWDVYDDNNFKVLSQKVDFKDKIVLVGTAAKGIKDVFSTPNGIEYGVYIHANMLNTILLKDYLVYFDKKLEWLLIFLLIILSVYFNFSRSSFVLIFSNIAIITIFLVILPITIIVFTNIIVNYPSEIIFSLVLSLTVSNIVKYLVENKDKDKLNKALSEYVSEDIAREVLSGEGKINLDGEKKKITIFFSDIAGFTTISEKFTPETLLPYLRDYLTAMSNVIIDGKGFINKYEGDAIMALWGVFGYQESMEHDACDAALLQMKLLTIMNKKLEKKSFPKVSIRIGIHTGDAILGNIGAKGRKIEFTALGDNVNLASRLEGVNKFYGTQICVSETVYIKTKEKYVYRFLDTIRVKGKSESLNIYELLGEKGKISSSVLGTIEKFSKGIEMYKKLDFQGAKSVFEKLTLLDPPSEVYVSRCQYFLKTPPPESWDGVWEMKEK